MRMRSASAVAVTDPILNLFVIYHPSRISGSYSDTNPLSKMSTNAQESEETNKFLKKDEAFILFVYLSKNLNLSWLEILHGP